MILKDTYNYYNVKCEYDKLRSDIMYFDIHEINDKNKQWKMYDIERNKLINKYRGSYRTLNKHDEIFNIGDKIDIYYMMDTRQGIIKQIDVVFDTCTWMTEYELTVELGDGSVRKIDSRVCIHLVEMEDNKL